MISTSTTKGLLYSILGQTCMVHSLFLWVGHSFSVMGSCRYACYHGKNLIFYFLLHSLLCQQTLSVTYATGTHKCFPEHTQLLFRNQHAVCVSTMYRLLNWHVYIIAVRIIALWVKSEHFFQFTTVPHPPYPVTPSQLPPPPSQITLHLVYHCHPYMFLISMKSVL